MIKNTKNSIIFLGIYLFSLLLLGIAFLPLSQLTSSEEYAIQKENEEVEARFEEIPMISESILWVENGNPICTETSVQAYSQSVSDGSGGAIIAWQDGRVATNNLNIYAQRVNSTGAVQWTANGIPICTATGNQKYVQLVSDDSGGAIIAWEDERMDSGDIYAQKVNSAGTIQWAVNGVAICNKTGDQYELQLVSDGSKGAIIVWMDHRSGTSDIYAQKINSAGVCQWVANGTVICNAINAQFRPHLVSDGSEGVIITWDDLRSGITSSDIYAQKIDSAGVCQWVANGIVICNKTEIQSFSQLVNCLDGVIIAWEDERSGTDDIYAQRINFAGVSQWTANGTVICNASNAQDRPQLINVTSESAIISWTDYRSSNYDIYAQKINSAGVCQWAVNGTVICNATGTQGALDLVSDSFGGAIITWDDQRSGYDIYAQEINSAGVCQWAVNGTVICNAIGTQHFNQLISDDSGGAIIAWEDERMDSGDIYAQRISSYNPPEATHPLDIATTTTGSEIINWSLTDDFSIGQYRVLAYDTYDNYYMWVDWTPWLGNDTNLEVKINRTASGIFNYTIEYYDGQGVFGIPDTVIVTITNQAPLSGDDDDGDDNNDDTDSSSIPGFYLTILGLSGGLAVISIAKTLIRKRITLRN